MRPITLIVLLVVVAAALVGGLLLIGRSPSDPIAVSADPTLGSVPAGEAAATPIGDPSLDATGSDRALVERAEDSSSSKSAASALETADEGPSVVVRGRVLGNRGRAIEGATVFAADSNGFLEIPLDEMDADGTRWVRPVKVKTDGDGRFEIRPRARSKVRLAIRAPGFAPLDREFALTGSERDVGDLTLDPSVLLSGRVVDMAGRPVDGAKIARLSSRGSGFSPFARARGALVAETKDDGRFEIDQLAAGTWRLLVTHEAHPDLVETGEVDQPGTVRSGLVFTLEEGSEIQGRVVGAPADVAPNLTLRATIQAGGEEDIAVDNPRPSIPSVRETRCAADGSFTLRGLKPGRSYRLTARDSDRSSFFGRTRGGPTIARAGDLGVEIPYRSESALVFQVLDAQTGAPVVDLSIRAGWGFAMPLLDEDGRPVKHFPEGRVRFGDLPSRPRGAAEDQGIELTIESAGYRPLQMKDVALLEGQDTDLGTLRMERGSVVRVQVLDDASGKPVENANVVIAEEKPAPTVGGGHRSIRIEQDDLGDAFSSGASQRARTGADGLASVTSLPGKTVRLRVRHPEHAAYESEPIVLPVGEDLERTVRIGVGGSVIVEVVDSKGTAVPGIEIDHQGPSSDRGELVFSSQDGSTDAEGRMVFEHLETGDHRFRMRQSSGPGFVTMGGPGGGNAVMRRMTSRGGGGGGEEEGWSTVTVVERASETLRLVAPARGSLVGRVTEADVPLANAELQLVSTKEDSSTMVFGGPFGGGGREARTDGRGEYLFDGVEEGEYRLEIRHASRAMAYEGETEVREGENRLNVDLPVAIVQGTVTGKDGKPLAGVRVRAERAPVEGAQRRQTMSFAVMVEDGGASEPEITMGAPGGGTPVSTDAEGRYSLRGVQPEVDLVVHATGKDVQPGKSEPFRVALDQIKKGVDVRLEDGGAIDITVKRANGGAPGRFLARATPVEGGEPKIQMMGPGGSAKLTGLKPGKWKVVLDPLMGPLEGTEESEPLEQEVVVVVGQAVKATFDAP